SWNCLTPCSRTGVGVSSSLGLPPACGAASGTPPSPVRNSAGAPLFSSPALDGVVSCDQMVSHFRTKSVPPTLCQRHLSFAVCPANSVTHFFFGSRPPRWYSLCSSFTQC